MYKNIYLFMVALSITLFVVGVKPALAEVYVNEGNVVSDPVFVSSEDKYLTAYNRFKVTKIIHRTYSDSTYSKMNGEWVINIES
ncbi:TPA: hypothetical protein VJS26_001767, partial [Streptococcus pyogenes]|nr:hypothetical protein [Streptococcus pyogenes]